MTTKSEAALLQVQGMTIGFEKHGSVAPVVSDLSFVLERGKTLGIVGESGSGKSISSLALMGLLPKSALVSQGSALFNSDGISVDLLKCTQAEMRQFRGKRIAMVFQEPMTSLNPLHTCGAQVAEVMRWHEGINAADSHKRCLALFEEVELPRPEGIFKSYPHQLSGGQKQRVMIAMALACSPDLLIADEPTTALDVTVQKRILELLSSLQERNQMGMIFITHDLGVVAEVAGDVLVMYKGKAIEYGPVKRIFNAPEQAYTKALIDCRPRLGQKPRRLPTVADFLYGKTVVAPDNTPVSHPARLPGKDALVRVDDLQVWYPTARSAWGKPSAFLKAVDGVSLSISKGETLGLVGESGCGKSTIGRALLRIQHIDGGSVHFDGHNITSLNPRDMRPWRRRIQLIFQDPYASLNPRLNIEQALNEPMKVHRLGGNAAERSARIDILLDRVGLPANAKYKYPHEFSGGQRQRICIARALVVEPDFIVCDESVSALDVSVQAQVLNLLNELKEEFGLTYLFISHDLSVVQYMADHIVVMRHGKIEEYAPASELYLHPKSAYTRSLIDAIPQL